jgi:hypothetical protein
MDMNQPPQACRISKSLAYTLVELEKDPVEALQALLRAARCLPRDVTLLEDVQQVWHTTDCQASLSELARREPERHAVRLHLSRAASSSTDFHALSARSPLRFSHLQT